MDAPPHPEPPQAERRVAVRTLELAAHILRTYAEDQELRGNEQSSGMHARHCLALAREAREVAEALNAAPECTEGRQHSAAASHPSGAAGMPGPPSRPDGAP